jgi:cobalt/nickel transport system ATP-binding protein
VDYTRKGLREHRQNVQLVLQDPDDQLFSADVAQDVSYGPANLGLTAAETRDRVDEALHLLGIEHLRRRPTHQLSYGERKRVATAGAVAMRPCILLLDEPTAGLDPAGVEEMFTALERLERHATTVVLSTHDVALALDWADNVALVVDGRVHQGDPTTLLADVELLTRARLRRPWPLAIAADLARDGLLDPGTRPRNATELHTALTHTAHSRGGRTGALSLRAS